MSATTEPQLPGAQSQSNGKHQQRRPRKKQARGRQTRTTAATQLTPKRTATMPPAVITRTAPTFRVANGGPPAVLLSMVQELPPIGSSFPSDKIAAWLEAAKSYFAFAYSGPKAA